MKAIVQDRFGGTEVLELRDVPDPVVGENDVLIQVRELEELNNRLHGILARHTGQTVERIARDTERDYFLSPEQAKAYGIIDEVYAERGASLISSAKGERAGVELRVGEEPSVEPGQGTR